MFYVGLEIVHKNVDVVFYAGFIDDDGGRRQLGLEEKLSQFFCQICYTFSD